MIASGHGWRRDWNVAEQEREILAMELAELDARAAESSVPYQVRKTDENAEA